MNTVFPLHKAVRKGDLENAKALLKTNPDLVFSKDHSGATPLHWAAKNNDTAMAELLLACGADLNARDNDGLTPLEWAAAYRVWDVERFLRQHSEPLGWSQPTSGNPFRFPSGDAYSVSDLVRLSEADSPFAANSLITGDFERWLAYAGWQRFAELAIEARRLPGVADVDRLASFLSRCRQEGTK